MMTSGVDGLCCSQANKSFLRTRPKHRKHKRRQWPLSFEPSARQKPNHGLNRYLIRAQDGSPRGALADMHTNLIHIPRPLFEL